MSIDRERSPETTGTVASRSKKDKLRTYGIRSAVILAMIGGGKGAYELNQNVRESRDADNIAAAERNKGCFELSRNRYYAPVGEAGKPVKWIRIHSDQAGIVSLSGLSAQARKDCELEGVEKQLEPFDSNRGTGVSLSDNTEIVTDSVEIKLPTPDELKASTEEELRKSRETSLAEHLEIATTTGLGAGGGGLLGLVGIGLTMAAGGAIRRR